MDDQVHEEVKQKRNEAEPAEQEAKTKQEAEVELAARAELRNTRMEQKTTRVEMETTMAEPPDQKTTTAEQMDKETRAETSEKLKHRKLSVYLWPHRLR